jgi:hypothetical protein
VTTFLFRKNRCDLGHDESRLWMEQATLLPDLE